MKTITCNDFKKICRLCLTQHRQFQSISTNSTITMIEECTPVHVTIGDDFPQLICEECFVFLEKIVLFRRTCVESEAKLYQADNEDLNKVDIPENKLDTSISLQPKIEAFIEQPNKINQETPIKTEEECLSLKTEIDGGKNVSDIDLADNHLSNNDDSDSDYEPLINIKNKTDLTNKTKINKTYKKHYYECEYKCGKTIGIHFGHYEKHLQRKHKPKLKRCPTCPKKMYSDVYFQKHIKKHADLTCTHCQKVFLHQNPYDKHLLTHGVHRPYACPDCDGTFQSKMNLYHHTKRVHKDSGLQEECPVCHKKMRKDSMVRHLKIHSDEARNVHNCPDCEKTFCYTKSLRLHQKIVHENQPEPKKFLCDLCGAPNKNKSSLVRHLRVHSDEKPHKCSDCNKSYKKKSSLKLHIECAHLNIRSHVCSICGLGFFNARILSNHQRTHTGEKPFICNICDTSFSFKAGLYLHMKAHHNVPKPVNLPKFY